MLHGWNRMRKTKPDLGKVGNLGREDVCGVGGDGTVVQNKANWPGRRGPWLVTRTGDVAKQIRLAKAYLADDAAKQSQFGSAGGYQVFSFSGAAGGDVGAGRVRGVGWVPSR